MTTALHLSWRKTPLIPHDLSHEDKTAQSSVKDKILRTFRILIYIDLFKLGMFNYVNKATNQCDKENG